MSNGWEFSAQAWIDSMGERGDWGREHVLDPVMLGRVAKGRFERALDVGCGEGRFCRMLKAAGLAATGIDPTRSVARDGKATRSGRRLSVSAEAEELDFEAASFDLVVSYLTLIDIADFRAAIDEMARVLKPGGSLLNAKRPSTHSCGHRSTLMAASWKRGSFNALGLVKRIRHEPCRSTDQFLCRGGLISRSRWSISGVPAVVILPRRVGKEVAWQISIGRLRKNLAFASSRSRRR